MNRRFWSFINILILALVVLGVNQLEASPQATKQVQLKYNGLMWTTSTKATDVAELLLEQLSSYDQLTIDPSPSTPIEEGMLINITDKQTQELSPTVANNLKSRQIQLAEKPAPPKVVKPIGPISSGLATWYRFGDKLTAASRKYPKGTRLKVVAVSSGKSVEVTVNDYGPSALTGIDLDLNVPAFEALAPLGAGKIKVKYYKL